jgi:hypothetical protein
MDDFKKHIKGFHGRRIGVTGVPAGQTCPCCRETDKRHSRRLARRRLREEDGFILIDADAVALEEEDEAGEE